ncbi:hypothetical protein T484DRAFT_1766225 [Baffinella frigidus]|nr:hypothetical protein T484DRAFT_1766225 [Cryptophyta sp. CCMP2293]
MMQLAAVCLLLLLLPAASSGGAGTPLHSAFAPPALGALLWTRAALRGRATSPAVPRFGVRAERMGGLRMVLERQPGWGGYVDRSNQVKASGGAVREGRKAVETALGGGADSTSPEGESITRKEAVLPPLGLVPALARRHPAAEDEIVRQIEREERPVLDLRVFLDCEERASLEIEKGAVLEFEDSEKGAASDFEEGSVSESAQTQANYQTSKKGRDATVSYPETPVDLSPQLSNRPDSLFFQAE